MISGLWLSESNNTNLDPPGEFLPVEYIGTYYEGGDGVIVGGVELDFTQIAAIFVVSFIRERFGYGASLYSRAWVRILNIALVQQQVFGVIIVDSFTPPAVANEFFEFPAYTQLACVAGDEGSDEPFGSCMLGEFVPAYGDTEAPSTPAFTE